MQSISAPQLKAWLDTENAPVLLDVRETWEYEICHITGSININMSDVNQMLEKLNPNDKTVVICHHGARSFQLGNYLEKKGFRNMINLEGGIDAWARTVDTNMTQY